MEIRNEVLAQVKKDFIEGSYTDLVLIVDDLCEKAAEKDETVDKKKLAHNIMTIILEKQSTIKLG